jgi:hypothetical protein
MPCASAEPLEQYDETTEGGVSCALCGAAVPRPRSARACPACRAHPGSTWLNLRGYGYANWRECQGCGLVAPAAVFVSGSLSHACAAVAGVVGRLFCRCG